jgi:hypothetical protein
VIVIAVIVVAIMVMVVVAIAPVARTIIVAAAERQPDREQPRSDDHFRDTHHASPCSGMQHQARERLYRSCIGPTA